MQLMFQPSLLERIKLLFSTVHAGLVKTPERKRPGRHGRRTTHSVDSRDIAADTADMRTRIVIVMALAATLVCPAVYAEEWLSLSKTSDERPTEIFIDLSSIAVENNIRSAQTKSVALLPWRNSAQPFNGATFGLQRISFDCNAGLVQVGGIVLHSADGSSVAFFNVEQSWKPLEDPLTKKMFDLVCAWKPTG
jgi:hypothetical protein